MALGAGASSCPEGSCASDQISGLETTNMVLLGYGLSRLFFGLLSLSLILVLTFDMGMYSGPGSQSCSFYVIYIV